MGFADYKRELLAPDFNANRILDLYFHSGQSFVFREADPEAEPFFKRELARRLHACLGIELHPLQLVLCGSAHLGFSPVPTNEKFGKLFTTESDIDVAVVSTELFDEWWRELQQNSPDQAVLERVAADLFWGFVNPANVKDVSEIGREWWNAFGKMDTKWAKGVRGRLYRNHWSMQSYHKHAIIGGYKMLKKMSF